MKTTNRTERSDKSGKHNDRKFNVENAPHIDPARMSQNKYWTYDGVEWETLAACEKAFYEEHFGQYFERFNDNHRKARHFERVKSIEQYLKCRQYRPEDQILQIGNRDEHATGEELWECALEYQKEFDDRYGDNCKIIDMALHLDEETPHVHVRRVWIAHDEDGREYISQTDALDEMGIRAPDPKADENQRFNNPKMTFSSFDQNLFRAVCKEHGLVIEEPKPGPTRKHLSTLEFKIKGYTEKLENMEAELTRLKEFVNETGEIGEEMEQEIKELFEFFEDPDLELQYRTQLDAAAAEESKKKQLEKLRAIFREEMAHQREEMETAYAIRYLQATKQYESYREYMKKERFGWKRGLE